MTAGQSAWVNTVTLESELSNQGRAVLHYKIQYPQFSGIYYQRMLGELNSIYKARAAALEQGRVRQLYCEATRLPVQTETENNPNVRYDVAAAFEMGYNENCVLSLYFDQYEFTGGAHGNTVRCSDTWNLSRGACVLLRDLFACSVNYKAYIVENVNKQIAAQSKENAGIYFDDYALKTMQYFNDKHFYLTPEGIAIYYQQYEIAPYSTGIPVFIIPYVPGFVLSPACPPRGQIQR